MTIIVHVGSMSLKSTCELVIPQSVCLNFTHYVVCINRLVMLNAMVQLELV